MRSVSAARTAMMAAIIIAIALFIITPVSAEAGSPSLEIHTSLSSSSIERGGYTTLTVTVYETGGKDHAYNILVQPEVASFSGIIFNPSSQSISRIDRNGGRSVDFKIMVSPDAEVGLAEGRVNVMYYESGLFNLGEFGPYFESSEFSFTVNRGRGSLLIKSDPYGASVYIDDSYRGVTPLTLTGIQEGLYDLVITKSGYSDYSEYVEVKADEKKTVNTKLQRETVSSPGIISGIIGLLPSGITADDIAELLVLGVLLLVLVLIIRSIIRRRKKKRKGDVEELVSAGKSPVVGFPHELLGKYEPLEFIGEGGFARVYMARKRQEKKIVAVKIPKLDGRTSSSFMTEVAAWFHLNHRNIVKLYAADVLPIPHLEMEYVEGIAQAGGIVVSHDLDQLKKPLSVDEAVEIVEGIAEGLSYGHRKGIYHLDLKPLNILLTPGKIPKIADFGLAKLSARNSMTVNRGYSPLYSAPEQLDGKTYGISDDRTDIYQLGVIFFELLTGRMPYEGVSPASIIGRIVSPSTKPAMPSEYDPELGEYDAILAKMLGKRKEDRYQSASELLVALYETHNRDREREELKNALDEAKETIRHSTDVDEIARIRREAVYMVCKLAVISARMNDKPELVNALEDLRDTTREYVNEVEKAIGLVEYMLQANVPVGESFLEELDLLIKRIENEFRET